MADALIVQHPGPIVPGNRKARQDYEQGLMLKALERVWERTDDEYFTCIQKNLNRFV